MARKIPPLPDDLIDLLARHHGGPILLPADTTPDNFADYLRVALTALVNDDDLELDEPEEFRKGYLPDSEPPSVRMSLDMSHEPGHWVTVGAHDNGTGRKVGGHPVLIRDGHVQVGHRRLHGKRIPPFEHHDEPEHRPALTRRQQGAVKAAETRRGHREYEEEEVQDLVRQARREKINPKSLHQLAAELVSHDSEFKRDVRGIVEDAKTRYRRYTGKAFGNDPRVRKAIVDQSPNAIPHWDSISKALASEHPHIFRGSEGYDTAGNMTRQLPEERLFDLVRGNAGEPLSKTDAYRQAFDILQEKQAEKRRELEAIPFSLELSGSKTMPKTMTAAQLQRLKAEVYGPKAHSPMDFSQTHRHQYIQAQVDRLKSRDSQYLTEGQVQALRDHIYRGGPKPSSAQLSTLDMSIKSRIDRLAHEQQPQGPTTVDVASVRAQVQAVLAKRNLRSVDMALSDVEAISNDPNKVTIVHNAAGDGRLYWSHGLFRSPLAAFKGNPCAWSRISLAEALDRWGKLPSRGGFIVIDERDDPRATFEMSAYGTAPLQRLGR